MLFAMGKRVAIIGGGFAGMATCVHRLESGDDVTLFDPLPPSESASGLSAGLLHPYIGRRAQKAWRADEAMRAAKKMLERAGPSVYRECGILRLPADEEQESHFRRCADLYEDAEWWDKRRVQEALPGSQGWPGLYIASGIAVDTAAYLEGLRHYCQKATFVQSEVKNLDELDFDQILVTAGAASRHLLPDLEPKIRPNSGEILTLQWPEEIPLPSLPVCCPKYLIPRPQSGTCLLGATYDRPGSSDKTDLVRVAARLYPQLLEAPILERKRGERAVLPGRQPPSWVRADERTWRFAGLGSRGLLYHALLTA